MKAVSNPPQFICSPELNFEQKSQCRISCVLDMVNDLPCSYEELRIADYKIAGSKPYCDPWTMERYFGFLQNNGSYALLEERVRECEKACPTTCSKIYYSTTLRGVSRFSKYKLSKMWNSKEKAEEIIGNYGVLTVGLERLDQITFRQYFSQTPEMLVGQLGGLLGLFLGGSLISLFHMVVFCAERVYDQVQKRGIRRKKTDKNSINTDIRQTL